MSQVLLSRVFTVDNQRVTLAAGVKDGAALVVLGLPDADGLNELANITIEYPMKSATSAIAFVESATEDVAQRGLAKYREEVRDLAERMNKALGMPYKPDPGYRTRGEKKPGR